MILAAQGGQQGGGFEFLIFIGLFFLILYFFMIRPQTKKSRDQRNFLSNLKKGDRIVTIGGIHGKILQDDEDTFLVEIDQNTKIRIEKSVISLDFTKALYERTGKGKNTKK